MLTRPRLHPTVLLMLTRAQTLDRGQIWAQTLQLPTALPQDKHAAALGRAQTLPQTLPLPRARPRSAAAALWPWCVVLRRAALLQRRRQNPAAWARARAYGLWTLAPMRRLRPHTHEEHERGVQYFARMASPPAGDHAEPAPDLGSPGLGLGRGVAPGAYAQGSVFLQAGIASLLPALYDSDASPDPSPACSPGPRRPHAGHEVGSKPGMQAGAATRQAMQQPKIGGG